MHLKNVFSNLLQILYFVVFVTILYLIIRRLSVEQFENNTPAQNPVSSSSVNEAIIKLYSELLQRQPSSQELSDAGDQLSKGTINLEGLRRKIIDSDEYQRNTKLQTNVLNPELTKMISDNELISYISKLYNEETGKIIPPTMELPLRDVYIYLDYNDYAFRAMLRNEKYSTFEKDVMTTNNVNKPQLIEIFLKYFTVDDLVKQGIEIFGANPSDKIPYSINKGDSINGLNVGGLNSGLFNKDKAAQALGNSSGAMLNDHAQYSMTQTTVEVKQPDDITKSDDNKIRIPVHKHDMVLIPEFAWSVPQERPQVCTTLGQKQLIQPVFTNSSLLLGTPLGEAAQDTQVGSIMPKFEYKEYITIPN